MAGTRPTIIAIQDLHRRTHLLHHQAATMDSPPQASQTSFIKEPTSIIGPSSKARSSNVSWPRTFRISTTKKKLQDEACLLLQPCIFHHQHSSSRRKIEKRGRGNRSCSRKKKEDKFEEYRDLFAKDFPKGMAAHYNFLTESIRASNTEHQSTYVQCHDTLPCYEGKAPEQTRSKFPEGRGGN